MNNNKFDKKRFLIGFIITFISTLLISGCIFGLKVLENTGNNNPWDYDILVNLIDALTIPGFIGVMFYFLTLVSQAGAFDIIGYSVKLVWYTTFHRNVRETALPKSYAEYKQVKRGKKPNSTVYMLIGSLPTLVIGVILLIPYYINL